MFKLDEILDKVKELHSHSILNNNEYYTEKLLQIIIDLSTIDNQSLDDVKSEVDENEIEKVKRKVPKWMKKTNQYNYKILKSYMDLSDCNEDSIRVEELEEYVGIGKVFLGHYNGLKTISEKNHAKVFDEINKQVKLWEPVAEFIEDIFVEENPIYRFKEKNYRYRGRQQNAYKNLIFDVIKEYLDTHLGISYKELQVKFNDLHASKVIFSEADYIAWLDNGYDNSIPRYFAKTINYNGSKYYILNQWGHDKNYDRLGHFINFARKELQYNIQEVKNT